MPDRDVDSNGSWQDDLYDLLRRHNITQFAYVPDAGHRILIDRSLADPDVFSVALTTEEEGVALMAGADLGGARGVLLMQSSGTGNCINMLSLIKGGHFPFLTLISMRTRSLLGKERVQVGIHGLGRRFVCLFDLLPTRTCLARLTGFDGKVLRA